MERREVRSARLTVATPAVAPTVFEKTFPGATTWIALVILTMPIREVSLGEFGPAHARIGDILVAACFALWLCFKCIRGGQGFTTNPLDRAVLLFLVIYCLSMVWADRVDFGLYRLMKLLRNGMLYLLLVDYLSADFPGRYRQVAMCFLVTGFMQTLAFGWSIVMYGGPSAVTMLLQAETVQSNDSILDVVRTDQGAGLMLRGVGSWLPLCIFIGISIIQSCQKVGRYNIWLLNLMMGLMIILSATRSAWIGLAAGFMIIGVFMINESKLKKLALKGVFLVLVLIGGMSLNLHSFIQARFAFDVLENDPAIQDRYDYFEVALDAFRESPFLGKGVGSIDPSELFIVHNVYLQVLGELGVIGGATFCAVIGLWIWALFSARKLAANLGDSFASRVSTTIIGLSIFFLTYFFAGHDLAGGEPWIAMGIASALFTYERRCSLPRPSRPRLLTNFRGAAVFGE